MSARILARVTVYKAADHYCNQAIVATLSSGELLCVFNEELTRRHADNGYLSLIRSSDGGRTWGGRLDEWGYGLREMGGEAMRAYFVRSDDGGLNWEYFSTIAYDPARITGYAEPAPIRLRDGRIVVMHRVHHRPTQRPDNIYMSVS